MQWYKLSRSGLVNVNCVWEDETTKYQKLIGATLLIANAVLVTQCPQCSRTAVCCVQCRHPVSRDGGTILIGGSALPVNCKYVNQWTADDKKGREGAVNILRHTFLGYLTADTSLWYAILSSSFHFTMMPFTKLHCRHLYYYYTRFSSRYSPCQEYKISLSKYVFQRICFITGCKETKTSFYNYFTAKIIETFGEWFLTINNCLLLFMVSFKHISSVVRGSNPDI